MSDYIVRKRWHLLLLIPLLLPLVGFSGSASSVGSSGSVSSSGGAVSRSNSGDPSAVQPLDLNLDSVKTTCTRGNYGGYDSYRCTTRLASILEIEIDLGLDIGDTSGPAASVAPPGFQSSVGSP